MSRLDAVFRATLPRPGRTGALGDGQLPQVGVAADRPQVALPLAIPGDQLVGEVEVGAAARGAAVVDDAGLAAQRHLAQARGARDRGLEQHGAELLGHAAGHVPAHAGPLVEHGEEDALQLGHLALRPLGVAELVQRTEQGAQRVPAQLLRLDGDQHAIAGAERRAGGGAEVRRAVHDDGVVQVAGAIDLRGQDVGALVQGGEQPVLVLEVADTGGDEEQVLQGAGLGQLGERYVVLEEVEQPAAELLGAAAERARHAALRIHADHQDRVAGQGEGRAQVHRGGGLAHAALAADQGEDPGGKGVPGCTPPGGGRRRGRVGSLHRCLSSDAG